MPPGEERNFALGFLSQFASMGTVPAGAAPLGGATMGGAAPMAMGSHTAGPGAFGAGTAGLNGAMSMAGMGGRQVRWARRASIPRWAVRRGRLATGPMSGVHGGGLYGSMALGGGLFCDSGFELNRESRSGILLVWCRSSRSHFRSTEDALSPQRRRRVDQDDRGRLLRTRPLLPHRTPGIVAAARHRQRGPDSPARNRWYRRTPTGGPGR